jgi:hypothetical protein
MKDNALKYCTTIAFSAAMLAFALSGISRVNDAGDILGFCMVTTAALWIGVCFGDPISAGLRKLLSHDGMKEKQPPHDQGGKES